PSNGERDRDRQVRSEPSPGIRDRTIVRTAHRSDLQPQRRIAGVDALSQPLIRSSGMSSSVVKVDNVTKRFSGHSAVDQLSLDVPGGGIFGLLGPNGAGKSTTIRMIMNIITPDEGRISVFGSDSSRDLSNRLGYLPEERGLYKKMKVI